MDSQAWGSPGKFRVTKDDLPVNEQFSRGSLVVATLATGALIEVVEVSVQLDDGRVRARLAEPAGWMSLKFGDAMFAQPEGKEPPDEALRPGCAAWQKTSLMIAARHGQADVIARALETSCAQPQLDTVDEAGNTALMIAAREGHLSVIDVLTGAGADLSIVNADGLTAADLASTAPARKAIREAEARYEALVKSVMMGAGSASSSAAVGSGCGGSGSASEPQSMVASITAEASAMMAASSHAAGSNSPGKFIIVHDSVPVNEEFSRSSAKTTTLCKGTVVDVVEVSLRPDDGRIRARIADPAGWISLRLGKTTFAQPA